jgi:hypothetical protein
MLVVRGGAHQMSMIPGAYERNTLTHRQGGSMGRGSFGSDGIPSAASALDAATILEREKEGGGGASQRPAPRPAHTALSPDEGPVAVSPARDAA